MDGLVKRVERKKNKAKENEKEEEKKKYSKEDLSNAVYEWFSQQDTDGSPRRSRGAIARSWNIPRQTFEYYTHSDPNKRRVLKNYGNNEKRCAYSTDDLRGAVNEWFTQMKSNDTSRLSKMDIALKWNVPYQTFTAHTHKDSNKRRKVGEIYIAFAPTSLASSPQSSSGTVSSTMPTGMQQSLFASSPAAMPTSFPSSSTTFVSSSKEFASAAGATSAAEGNATSTASFSLASVDEYVNGVKNEPADFADLNIADLDASPSVEVASASGATAALTGNATSTASFSLASANEHANGVKEEPVDFDELNIADIDESLCVEDEGDADSSAECCCKHLKRLLNQMMDENNLLRNEIRQLRGG